jgi:putative oxidoreductase
METTTVRSSNPLTLLFTNKLFIFVLRLFLGGMFVYSSWHKIADPGAFAISIRGYQLLPIAVTNIFALFIAYSEALAGIMLILGIMTRKAAGAIFVMLVMFTIAIMTTIVRGIAVDCGCFSNEGGHSTNYTLVIRNLFLITASMMVMLFDGGLWSLDSLFRRKGKS